MAETITRDQVIALIDTLPSETLPELAQFAEFLRFRMRPRDASAITAEERSLAQIIQRRLAPEQQHRLDALRGKNEMGLLTGDERAELLAIVEQVENADAQRAQALIDLARLRQVPVAVLMRELALEHPTSAN
jgi:hypothetical protein